MFINRYYTQLPISDLKENDSVKLFNGKEYMWITLYSISGSKLTGIVDTVLKFKFSFNYGDILTFDEYNIFDIQTIEYRSFLEYLIFKSYSCNELCLLTYIHSLENSLNDYYIDKALSDLKKLNIVTLI